MRSICDYQKTRFFDSFKPIYRHVIGMRKKILFKVKYVRVYLMLNALCVKPIDYKSIALPAELQGHKLFCIMNLRFIKLIFFVGLYNEKQ